MSCVWNTHNSVNKTTKLLHTSSQEKVQDCQDNNTGLLYCHNVLLFGGGEGRSGWLRDQPPPAPSPPPHHKAHPHFGSRPTNYHLCFILVLFQQDDIMNVHCSAFFIISCKPTKLEKKEEEKSYKSSSLQSICLLRSIIDERLSFIC